MNARLAQIIDYKTGGRKREFAQLCGWTPQYLTKLLAGENFGLQPVLAIVRAVPELNARWLLLGEGEMLHTRERIQDETLCFVRTLLDYEKYLPIMTAAERTLLEDFIRSRVLPPDLAVERASLEKRYLAHLADLEAKFAAANEKSEELCRLRTRKQ